jgi:hypothetical protein
MTDRNGNMKLVTNTGKDIPEDRKPYCHAGHRHLLQNVI